MNKKLPGLFAKVYKKIRVVGVMSGTSLDGLDIACVDFNRNGEQWKYTIRHAETLPYSKDWNSKLTSAYKLNGFDLLMLHNEYGTFIGESIRKLLMQTGYRPDLIASHGHTVFHQPGKGITFQIGNGASIAAFCGVTTVSDFRTFDVALGGQGAPLVPIGDQLLFGNYLYCLNLGGFSNISFQKEGKRMAFDICPVNLAINYYANQVGKVMDEDGNMARIGEVIPELLNALNNLDFYSVQAPKSLGREWVEQDFIPLVESFNVNFNDKLRTIYEHIVQQIVMYCNKPGTVLCTGGGTKNSFLIELIQKYSSQSLVIPDTLTIDFKEAVVFAFLGVLRYFEEINCLSSVTGSKFDHTGGVIHLVK